MSRTDFVTQFKQKWQEKQFHCDRNILIFFPRLSSYLLNAMKLDRTFIKLISVMEEKLQLGHLEARDKLLHNFHSERDGIADPETSKRVKR